MSTARVREDKRGARIFCFETGELIVRYESDEVVCLKGGLNAPWVSGVNKHGKMMLNMCVQNKTGAV